MIKALNHLIQLSNETRYKYSVNLNDYLRKLRNYSS